MIGTENWEIMNFSSLKRFFV